MTDPMRLIDPGATVFSAAEIRVVRGKHHQHRVSLDASTRAGAAWMRCLGSAALNEWPDLASSAPRRRSYRLEMYQMTR